MAKTSRFPEFSLKRNKPILEPSEITEAPKYKKLDCEWKEAIEGHFWATNYTGKLTEEQRRHIALRDHILNFGGEEVCMPAFEEHIEQLLKHGEIWTPASLILKRGNINQCHSNAALLWEANKTNLKLATGYYLHQDGMWRSHSWCLRKNTKGGRIVETTRPAILYFGITLTEEEAEEQVYNSY